MNFMRLSLFVNQCTTIQYVNSLKVACDTLREIIAILGPIRVDSVEGGNGLKVTPPPPHPYSSHPPFALVFISP